MELLVMKENENRKVSEGNIARKNSNFIFSFLQIVG